MERLCFANENDGDSSRRVPRGDQYSLRLTESVVLAFKFCSTKNIVLTYNKINLIKVISSTKKTLHRKTYRVNRIFNRYYFSSSSSNAYALIEDSEN